jgi:predicted RNA-binding Zn-ribbon protein involved in translation (DUF1610 family)
VLRNSNVGLAGSFGDQGYKCSACGMKIEHYSPHCPNCLNKNLIRLEQVKKPVNATTQGPAGPADERRAGFPIAAILMLLAVLGAAYYAFSGQQSQAPETTTKPVKEQVAATRPRPVKRVAKAAPRKTAAAATNSAPRRNAGPMKIWSVESD